MKNKKKKTQLIHRHHPGGEFGWFVVAMILVGAVFAVSFYVLDEHNRFENEVSSGLVQNNGILERKAIQRIGEKGKKEVPEEFMEERGLRWRELPVNDTVVLSYPDGWHAVSEQTAIDSTSIVINPDPILLQEGGMYPAIEVTVVPGEGGFEEGWIVGKYMSEAGQEYSLITQEYQDGDAWFEPFRTYQTVVEYEAGNPFVVNITIRQLHPGFDFVDPLEFINRIVL